MTRNIRRHLQLPKDVIRGLDSYNYLEVKITSYASNEVEIKARIKQGKLVTRQLNSVLWNTPIRPTINIRIYKTIIETYDLRNNRT